jgi:hypothetical protein
MLRHVMWAVFVVVSLALAAGCSLIPPHAGESHGTVLTGDMEAEEIDVVAFYLLDEQVPSNALRGDLNKLKLAKKPLLILQDIVAFAPQGGQLFLREPARKRLFEGTGWEESNRDREFTEAELADRRAIGRRSSPHFRAEPFVLVVDGKRILGGHVPSHISSPYSTALLHSPSNAPVYFFCLEKQMMEPFIAAMRREGKVEDHRE